jgi:nucleoside-diphosphate-sugar epimerase
MKKILITGGAGYIGSMLSTELVKMNYDVTVIDDLYYSLNSLNHLLIYKNFKLIKGDVRDKSLIKKLILNKDFIIPLAALVGAPLCDKNKKAAIQINYEAIKFILNNIKKKQKIIYMNSNSGYGVGEKNKFCDETSPLRPISLYGITKNKAEKIVMKFKNSISFRLATVFGISYRMRTDLLVNFMVYESMLKNKLKIFEPHFRRNFVHVRDVVAGIIFAIKNFSKLKSNVYNLGLSSANITKIQLATKIKKYKKNLKIKIIKNIKDPDQRDYFVSNRKIEKAGFKAKTSLDEGILELIKMFQINKNPTKNNY